MLLILVVCAISVVGNLILQCNREARNLSYPATPNALDQARLAEGARVVVLTFAEGQVVEVKVACR